MQSLHCEKCSELEKGIIVTHKDLMCPEKKRDNIVTIYCPCCGAKLEVEFMEN